MGDAILLVSDALHIIAAVQALLPHLRVKTVHPAKEQQKLLFTEYVYLDVQERARFGRELYEIYLNAQDRARF